jgi:hypothetical protein
VAAAQPFPQGQQRPGANPAVPVRAPRGTRHVCRKVEGGFVDWVRTVETRDLVGPFTYVVDVDGVLRLAPRRSEHVACAGGGKVLAAGEVALVWCPAGWTVSEVSNQSTGYCPDPSSWSAVAAALDRAGLDRPGGFTSKFVFGAALIAGNRAWSRTRTSSVACAAATCPGSGTLTQQVSRLRRSGVVDDDLWFHRR